MNDNQQTKTGRVAAIAFRPTDGQPMKELTECNVLPGRGLDCENRRAGKREVTLLSKQSWEQTCRELDVEIPWYIRRANFLIDGLDLAALIDREITIGPIRVKVHGETRPCDLMEKQQPGLLKTLVPDGRGGVFGQVLTCGIVRVGDSVRVHDSNDAP